MSLSSYQSTPCTHALTSLNPSRFTSYPGRAPNLRSPLWALSMCSPLSSRLQALDLSFNPGLVWDEVQWMSLVASLRQLRSLDVRGTGGRREEGGVEERCWTEVLEGPHQFSLLSCLLEDLSLPKQSCMPNVHLAHACMRAGLKEPEIKSLLWSLLNTRCKSSLEALSLGPPTARAGELLYSFDFVVSEASHATGCSLREAARGLGALRRLEVAGGLTGDQQQDLMVSAAGGHSGYGAVGCSAARVRGWMERAEWTAPSLIPPSWLTLKLPSYISCSFSSSCSYSLSHTFSLRSLSVRVITEQVHRGCRRAGRCTRRSGADPVPPSPFGLLLGALLRV
jgi:hypothetical protein